MNDGTTLRDDSEQETVVHKRTDFGEKTLPPTEIMVACPACELPNRANSKFCKKCGTDISSQPASIENHVSSGENTGPSNRIGQPGIKQAEPFMFPSLQDPSPNINETQVFQSSLFTPPNTSGQTASLAPAKSNRNLFLVIGALAGVIIIGLIFWLANRPHAAEAKLDKAISSNKLIAPAGESAYDFYQELKKDNVDPKILQKFEDRLFPLLNEKPQEILKTVMEPGITEKNMDEWQDAAKMLEWASEMRPGDSQIAAKAAYCKGRVKFMNDRWNEAIEDWKKSADLDKKSALALNGIGVAYNSLKNYEAAKEWLQKAIDREPAWAFPYNNLGSAFYYQKRYGEALQYYRKAAEIAPRWARVRSWLASVAAKTGDYTTCVSELEFVLSPEAVGASELKLDEIRRAKENCENKANQYYYEY
jgi:tetratricopeptide (TPR) repeat protein